MPQRVLFYGHLHMHDVDWSSLYDLGARSVHSYGYHYSSLSMIHMLLLEELEDASRR
ncbi:hypothetical protein B0H12DRAFT_1116802 [Mycena haematopus]|nr:hypothetical protein B0H12DRAFT_1116802 [Mycena haematopus]